MSAINPMVVTTAAGLASKFLDKAMATKTVAPRETLGMPAGIQLAAAVVPTCIAALVSVWNTADERSVKIHAENEEHLLETLREMPDDAGGKQVLCATAAMRLGEVKSQTMDDRLKSTLATKALIGAVAAGGLVVAYVSNSQAHAEQMSRQSQRGLGFFGL